MTASKAARGAKARGPKTPAELEAREAPGRKAGAVHFPIVGIGASAGGLEAFEQFFREVPRDSGMAFVLVQHLDPSHSSILTEILQRSTALPVVEAQDQMKVAPDHVYVIPPNHDLAVFHGALQLSVPEQPHGHRLPIDSFLRSLAEDQGEQAIGVILSGTGTDGTLGLRAILGAGGVSFVQEPASAKFDGMPSSAIQAGYATHVLPVEELPRAILASVRTLAVPREALPETDAGLRRILMLLRSSTGHDFSLYKPSTINRRIERRMMQHGIADLEIYARFVQEHPAEIRALFTGLLIRVTSFFRDQEAFSALKKDALPGLLAGKPPGYVFRVWVAGCATGEEAYSIAILLREFMEESGQDFQVQLYGTDMDEDAITLARAGRYPPNIVQDVEPGRLRRFFIKDEAGYRVQKAIRETAVFAVQDVLKDPPFINLDLLSCRNLMIYLKPEHQDRVLSTFHFALKPGGVLFLSTSEGTGSHPGLFVPLDRRWRLYRAIHAAASARHAMANVVSPATRGDDRRADATVTTGKETSLAELTNRLLLQFYAPTSLITDPTGNILYVHGETDRFLRPAPGKPTLNVVDMAHEELRQELRAAIHRAASSGTQTLGHVVPARTGGDSQAVSFSVRPLPHPDSAAGLLLVSFQAIAGAAPARPAGKRAARSATARHIEELERDLAYARETLHATLEEQQASNEELKSTNEELQSTNEELQSTNEELETSKEELQSINEELVTVNSELQTKIELLAGMQSDMKNLLDNVNAGTIFLDEDLFIRRFSRDAVQIYHLVPTDVGRSLRDIKSHLEGDDLLAVAEIVLGTLIPDEREVRTVQGAWYLARIQPYRTLDNVIDGVVLTFVDITEMKRVREELQVARELAEGIVDTVREPLIVLDGAMRVVSASRSFYHRFRLTPAETVSRSIYELGENRWDIPALRELLETVMPRDGSFDDYAMEQGVPSLGRAKMLLSARRIVSGTGDTQLILLAMEVSCPGERESA
jgi:two-component system, chemotaxis family, CheB/CheR fusion protein